MTVPVLSSARLRLATSVCIAMVMGATGCGPEFIEPGAPVHDVGARSLNFEQVIVDVANQASFEVLDLDVPLDVRAARGLVEMRPYATLDEVDAVPYVGPVSLERMYAYGLSHGYGRADDGMVDLANALSPQTLAAFAGWDQGLIDARPFVDLSTVPQPAIDGLRAFADARDACVDGHVYTAEGLWYDDLADAAAHTPDDVALMACEGEHRLPWSRADRSLTLHGMGHATIIDVDGDSTWFEAGLELVDLTWMGRAEVAGDLTLQGVASPSYITIHQHDADADPTIRVSDSLLSGDWIVERTDGLRHGGEVSFRRSTFSGHVAVHAVAAWNEAPTRLFVTFEDCVFRDSHSALLVAGSDGHLSNGLEVTVAIANSVFRGNEVALSVDHDALVELAGVDFSVGDDDNGIDIREQHPHPWVIQDLHDDVWGRCDVYGCDLD